jgi:putative transposase
VGQPRSTQRLAPPVPTDDELALRAWLREFSRKRPRWGWRRAATEAAKAGWQANRKRIHRLWREEGLPVPYRKRKRPLRGIGVAVGAMCPIRPNVVWALDFQFDQTADGRQLKLLNVIDEYSRECLAIDVERSIDADGVVRCLQRLALERGAPKYVRFDHGPEFIAHAVADWCRFNGTDTVFIDPGSPWQNAWIESFNGRLRDEFLKRSALRHPPRSEGPPRRLAHRLQHQPATLGPRRTQPNRVRRGLAQPTTATTRITAGPEIGDPSRLLHGSSNLR